MAGESQVDFIGPSTKVEVCAVGNDWSRELESRRRNSWDVRDRVHSLTEECIIPERDLDSCVGRWSSRTLCSDLDEEVPRMIRVLVESRFSLVPICLAKLGDAGKLVLALDGKACTLDECMLFNTWIHLGNIN